MTQTPAQPTATDEAYRLPVQACGLNCLTCQPLLLRLPLLPLCRVFDHRYIEAIARPQLAAIPQIADGMHQAVHSHTLKSLSCKAVPALSCCGQSTHVMAVGAGCTQLTHLPLQVAAGMPAQQTQGGGANRHAAEKGSWCYTGWGCQIQLTRLC
jgi:hypothetical protein